MVDASTPNSLAISDVFSSLFYCYLVVWYRPRHQYIVVIVFSYIRTDKDIAISLLEANHQNNRLIFYLKEALSPFLSVPIQSLHYVQF
jgi:hypothetical protein